MYIYEVACIVLNIYYGSLASSQATPPSTFATVQCTLYSIYTVGQSQKKDRYRRVGKGRRCWLGGRTLMRHEAFSRNDDLKKSFCSNIHFGRIGGLVRCEQNEHPFL